MTPVWQYITAATQLLMSFAGLALLFQIARKLGAWEEWRKWVDKQLQAIGKMTQEQGNKISEIWGRLTRR